MKAKQFIEAAKLNFELAVSGIARFLEIKNPSEQDYQNLFTVLADTKDGQFDLQKFLKSNGVVDLFQTPLNQLARMAISAQTLPPEIRALASRKAPRSTPMKQLAKASKTKRSRNGKSTKRK